MSTVHTYRYVLVTLNILRGFSVQNSFFIFTKTLPILIFTQHCLFSEQIHADPQDGSGTSSCFRIRNYCSRSSQKCKGRYVSTGSYNLFILGRWILDCVYCRTGVWSIKWQIIDRFFVLIGLGFFKINSNYASIIWVASGTWPIRSWIRESFRIRNTAFLFFYL